jgi:Fe-S-cluster containining protein
VASHPLPPLYARWTSELLGAPAPSEPLATCDDCALCPKASGEVPTSLYVFSPEVKCCVYMPRLPNFLVGGILREAPEDPGRRSVEARIDGRIGVTPLGLDRPPSYELRFRNSVNAIGRARSLRCPHYLEDGGRCGIHAHRDATCATWFCRHERGALGGAFWSAHRELLSAAEAEVARWCALKSGLAPERLQPLLGPAPADDHAARRQDHPDGPALDGEVSPEAWSALWGDRTPRAHYLACAELASSLSWSDVLELAGTELQVRAATLRRAQAALSAPLPERLSVGAFQVAGTRPGGVRVVTHSSLDALDLPNALVGLLPLFDGRPVVDVLAQIEASWGARVDPPLLRQLVDWGVLVAAGESG